MRYLSELSRQKFLGKTCLLRVDLNVGDAKEALRLRAILPTMKFLLGRGAKIIILSHRGRPEGEQKAYDSKLSLRIFLPFLRNSLRQNVIFLKDIPGRLPSGRVFLMENLRFWPEEEGNDPRFAKKLARLGDFYVNDAFGTVHRKNASITQLPKLLPSCAGLLLEKEVKALSAVMKMPKRPLVLIFGGAKVEDKIAAIKNLLSKANAVLLGSSIMQKVNFQYFTLLKGNKKVVMPIDWISDKGSALDVGPLTVEEYKKYIRGAKTIIWNGPLGKFEDKRFAGGSMAIARAIAKSGAFSIVGGGETTQLFMRTISNSQFLISKKRLFLSTGGGAMLEFLSGKILPGIKALEISPPAGG